MQHHANKRTIIWLTVLVLLAIFSSWLALSISKGLVIKQVRNDALPNQVIQQAEVWQMDKTGKVNLHFTAQRLQHYTKNNITFMQQPHFLVYSKKQQPPWDITANQGKAINGTKHIQLWDNVVIHQNAAKPKSHATTILTEEIMLTPSTHIAETKKPVTIMQHGATLKGVGLKANLQKHWLRILSHVKAYYNPSDFNKAAKSKPTRQKQP